MRTGDWDAELLALVGLDRALLPELVDAGNGDRQARRHSGRGGRLPRHRVGGRRGAADRAGRGVHLVRHLGAGRRRAGPAGAHGRGPRRQLHQRGRRRRADPLPHQRDGHVAALRDPAQLGRRRPGDLAGRGGGVRRPGARCSTCRTRGSCRPATCRPHRGLVPRARRRAPGRPGRHRAQHRAQPRRGVRARGRPGVVAVGPAAYAACTSSAAAPRTPCSASCSPTGSACPVLAGPVEATALGNVLVQARALGAAARQPRGPAGAGRPHPSPRSPRARRGALR